MKELPFAGYDLRPAPPRIDAAVRQAFASIPGIGFFSIHLDDDSTVVVDSVLWTPGYHGLEWRRWFDLRLHHVTGRLKASGIGEVRTRKALDDYAKGLDANADLLDAGRDFDMESEASAAMILDVVSDIVAHQTMLAGMAAKIGIVEPLPASDPRIDHLSVSKATIALMLHKHPPEVAAWKIMAALKTVLQCHGDRSKDGEATGCETEIVGHVDDGNDDCIVTIHEGAPLLEVEEHLDRTTSPRGHLFGDTLTLLVEEVGMIPATILTACVGRPMSSVAVTGVPAIDDSIILEASHDDGFIDFHLESELIPLSDDPVLGPLLRS